MTERRRRRSFWRAAPVVALLALSSAAGATLTGAEAAAPTAPTAAPTAATTVAAAVPGTGTTKTLVMLASWTGADSVTPEQAKQVVFTDTGAWFRDVSYGALGLTGDVTPWLSIKAPTGGLCYTNGGEIMAEAKVAAKAAGKDPANYQAHIVYFPYQSHEDCRGFPGWASGTGLWLNGRLNVPVLAHELGHVHGLHHSGSLMCTGPIDSTCTFARYGDDYDTMGRADETAHYSAPQKDKLGWLGGGRQVDLSKGGTATLRPMADPATNLKAIKVTTAEGRTYWIEYRRKIGRDANMKIEGVGVQVRFTGTGSVEAGPVLIDPTPRPVPTVATATLPANSTWTSPDGFTIKVGTTDASSAPVTVGLPPVIDTIGTTPPVDFGVTVGGTANLFNAPSARYAVRYGTTTAYGSTTPIKTVNGSRQADGTHLVAFGEKLTGLTAGATYHYSVVLSTDWGTVASADQTFVAVGAVPVRPPVIDLINALPMGGGVVKVGGTAKLYAASSATQTVRFGPTTAYGRSRAKTVHGARQADGTYHAVIGDDLTGLAPGVYHYSLTITTSAGTVSSPDRTFVVTAPPAIGAFGVHPIGNGSVTFLGHADLATSSTATQTIRYGTTSAYGKTTPARTITGNPATNGTYSAMVGDTVTGLVPGTIYHYSVTLTTPNGTITSPDKTFVA